MESGVHVASSAGYVKRDVHAAALSLGFKVTCRAYWQSMQFFICNLLFLKPWNATVTFCSISSTSLLLPGSF
jgi:hypothetical protein